MGDSMKVALNDALKMVGIEQDTLKENVEIPQASWDLYEMIQAFMQVIGMLNVPIGYSYEIIDDWYEYDKARNKFQNVYYTGTGYLIDHVHIASIKL